jgi:hypothetical protein
LFSKDKVGYTTSHGKNIRLLTLQLAWTPPLAFKLFMQGQRLRIILITNAWLVTNQIFGCLWTGTQDVSPKPHAVIILASPANSVAILAAAATITSKPPSILKKAAGTGTALTKPATTKTPKNTFLPSHQPNFVSKSLNPSIIGKVDFREESRKFETYITVQFPRIKGKIMSES